MKFSGREKRAKGRVRILRARGSAELRMIASGSATQGLWLRNGKMRSQVSGIDESRFSGKRTARKVRRGGRRVCTDLELDLGEREEQVVCHASPLALAMTDEARREADM